MPWDEREFLGWRDPRAPLRGYAVWWRDGRPLGIALRAADTSMSSRSAAMCLLCQSTQSGIDVSLFTARRAGEAGRNGNTVGQYICADLDCSRRVRTDIPPWLQTRDPDEVILERAAALQSRLDGFADHVLRVTERSVRAFARRSHSPAHLLDPTRRARGRGQGGPLASRPSAVASVR